MGKNAIVGQSGGPTSVINASLAGVFESCKSRGADIVYGMCNGVAGLLEELEDSRNLVAVLADLCSNAVRKRARNVLVESAAGDVADGLHAYPVSYTHLTLPTKLEV